MNREKCLLSPRARRVFGATLLLLVVASAAVFSAACSNPEQTKAAHLAQGEAYLQEEKFQEAVIEFRNALQIDARSAPAFWGLAQAYEKLERFNEAVEALQRVIRIDPDNIDARLKLANFYLVSYERQKSPEYLTEAERLANEVIEKNPNHVDGNILFANVLSLRGKRDEALSRLRKAIELDPRRVESHLALARFHMQTDDLGQMFDSGRAEEAFQSALSINDRSSVARVEYGKFFISTARPAQAEEQFKKAVESAPSDRDVRLVLASFYLVNRRMPEAEEAYKALADLDRDKPEGRAVLADFYSMVGRYDEAIKIYEDAVSNAPDFARGRERLGELMLRRGDLAGAERQVAEILGRNQNDLKALLLRARVALQRGEPKKAVEDLKEVLKQDPRHKIGLYYMAEASARTGQGEQARGYAADLERFYPQFLPAKLMQAQLALADGDAKTGQRLAAELLERLSKAAPGSELTPQLIDELRAKSFSARGSANLQLGDLAAARADMEAARAAAPNTPVSYTNLASVAAAERNADEALRMFERALDIDATHFDALSGIIKIYAETNRLNDAHACLDRALASRPDSAGLHFLKAKIYELREPGVERSPEQSQDDVRRAEASLRRAVELDPSYTAAYQSLAALYFNLRQPELAIAEYRKIAERQPDNAGNHTLMGMVEYSRNNYDAAAEHYRRAIQIDPASAIAANNLAMLASDHGTGNLDEAVQLAQGVVRRFPDQPGYADTLGWVYYKKGLYAPAVEQSQKAVRMSAAKGGDNALYRYHLGLALAGAGRRAEARRELQAAQRLAAQEATRGGAQFAQAEDLRRALATL